MKYLSYQLSPAMWARVLLLWLTLSVGALVVGLFALYMGNFVHQNISDELEIQQISFGAAENLSEEELAIPGLEENAGQQVLNGNQARIYSELILLHVSESATEAGYENASYATLGGIQRGFRTAVSEARDAGDEAALEEAQAQLDAVTNLRNSMLTASTLRGNLLSAYGWDNVATGITYSGVGVLVLALVFFGLFVFEWRRGHLPAA